MWIYLQGKKGPGMEHDLVREHLLVFILQKGFIILGINPQTELFKGLLAENT